MSRRSRTEILTVPNAGKVDLLGAQDEAIYLEFSTRQIAALGLDQQAVVQSLQAQNAIAPSGVIQAGPERDQPCASAASSPRRRACAPSICASTTASSG